MTIPLLSLYRRPYPHTFTPGIRVRPGLWLSPGYRTSCFGASFGARFGLLYLSWCS